jgi:hypothetical protein
MMSVVPLELEMFIFKIAGAQRRTDIPAFMRVAKRVKVWYGYTL